MQKISDKILNHLAYSKSSGGLVGCQVKPTMDSLNKAWLSIRAKKGYDIRAEPNKEYITGYEIEFIELDKNYSEEETGMDFDLFLIKKIVYYNLKNVDQLERILREWISDFASIQPISNISHPMY